jgi:hypothetical protein
VVQLNVIQGLKVIENLLITFRLHLPGIQSQLIKASELPNNSFLLKEDSCATYQHLHGVGKGKMPNFMALWEFFYPLVKDESHLATFF